VIAIVDYGLGNILAFANVYKRLNIAVRVARKREDLVGATRLILPGVGAFDHAVELLDASGMRESLEELVLGRGTPVLGICVGMQLLARSSDEGKLPGLGWVSGTVRKFSPDPSDPSVRLPHMGWNDVTPAAESPMFNEFGSQARFYFLHSYYFSCDSENDVLARTDYGIRFASAVHHKNIWGVQFHPEKSHHFGTQLLRNFATS
jgi:imidazole glycerol-phosphate synthase subunit HisH